MAGIKSQDEIRGSRRKEGTNDVYRVRWRGEDVFAYIHRPVPNAVDDEGEEGRRKFKELKKGYKMTMQDDERKGRESRTPRA